MFLRLRGSGVPNECGSVRAFLTGQFKPIDHRWIAERFQELRGDSLIRFNREQFLASTTKECGLRHPTSSLKPDKAL